MMSNDGKSYVCVGESLMDVKTEHGTNDFTGSPLTGTYTVCMMILLLSACICLSVSNSIA